MKTYKEFIKNVNESSISNNKFIDFLNQNKELVLLSNDINKEKINFHVGLGKNGDNDYQKAYTYKNKFYMYCIKNDLISIEPDEFTDNDHGTNYDLLLKFQYCINNIKFTNKEFEDIKQFGFDIGKKENHIVKIINGTKILVEKTENNNYYRIYYKTFHDKDFVFDELLYDWDQVLKFFYSL